MAAGSLGRGPHKATAGRVRTNLPAEEPDLGTDDEHERNSHACRYNGGQDLPVAPAEFKRIDGAVLCGRLRLCKDSEDWRRSLRSAVMCPTCWCGVSDRWPDEVREPVMAKRGDRAESAAADPAETHPGRLQDRLSEPRDTDEGEAMSRFHAHAYIRGSRRPKKQKKAPRAPLCRRWRSS